MKKFIFTVLLITSPVFAVNDKIIVSEFTVNNVFVKDEKIVNAKPFYTINNDKKEIIVTPINKGETTIELNTTDNKKEIAIKVDENKNLLIKKTDGIEIYTLDLPPQDYDIPIPPDNIPISLPPKGGI